MYFEVGQQFVIYLPTCVAYVKQYGRSLINNRHNSALAERLLNNCGSNWFKD
ncbi:hypothetical protein MHTCC0001_37490 [Flavobacteriaceae bacterium MHTCC 0001]